MRARARLAGIAAIGAAIGLALSAVIAAPATAAKPQPSATASTATYSCSHFSGLTVANGRAYIATFDGTLYCFGIAR